MLFRSDPLLTALFSIDYTEPFLIQNLLALEKLIQSGIKLKNNYISNISELCYKFVHFSDEKIKLLSFKLIQNLPIRFQHIFISFYLKNKLNPKNILINKNTTQILIPENQLIKNEINNNNIEINEIKKYHRYSRIRAYTNGIFSSLPEIPLKG